MSAAELVRGVVAGLAEGNKKVSNALIFKALGLETEPEKAKCRSRISSLVRQKELIRVEPGLYEYKPKAMKRHGEGYVRMWRSVRVQTRSFDIPTICQVSHLTQSAVSRYLNYLEAEKLIRRSGKNGNLKLWAVTSKGRDTRETPFPPLPIKDPFATERAAISRLARLFFEKDLYIAGNAEKVVKECEIILNRFAKTTGINKQDEKKENVDE